MDEDHHYDLALQKDSSGTHVLLRLCIGNIKSVEANITIHTDSYVTLYVVAQKQNYEFFLKENDHLVSLGFGLTRYLSSEVCGGFTGVMMGLYAHCLDEKNEAVFKNFKCQYKQDC
jgi:alpha-N-arabinofuranosidase